MSTPEKCFAAKRRLSMQTLNFFLVSQSDSYALIAMNKSAEMSNSRVHVCFSMVLCRELLPSSTTSACPTAHSMTRLFMDADQK